MNRRKIGTIGSIASVFGAGIVLVLALFLQGQGDFAKTYVADQLSAQRIAFTPAEKLSDEEKEAACLVTFGGQPMTTGKQAECYANEYIELHLEEMGAGAGYPGATFASLGSVVRGSLPAAVEAAQKAVDDAKAIGMPTSDLESRLAAAKAELAKAAGLRESLFQGETLRGLLLTVYGFSVMGDLAAMGGQILLLVAGVLVIVAGGFLAWGRKQIA